MAEVLTRAAIIELVHSKFGLPKKECSETFETILDIIKTTLASGEDVLISGFGKFSVRDKKARRGRNPATNESLMIEPRRVVTFKCSGNLRDRINGDD